MPEKNAASGKLALGALSMFWPILTLLSMASVVGVHVFWGRRFRGAEQAASIEIENLKQVQRRASLQLQAQQKALLDSMVEGLLVLDGRGRISLANRAFATLFGVTVDIRGRTILEAVRLHELAELLDQLGTQQEVLGTELRLSRPVDRWVQVNGAVVCGADGQRQGTVLVFHDLTRIKQLEDMRKDFVANVSHELRTPLSLIQGYVETLLDGAKDNPEVETRFLQTIERNTGRLRRLIEDLLVISELESGRLRLNPQPVALNSVVRKVFEDFKARAEAAELELRNQAPELTVHADPDRVEQVLSNLVDNAIKYGHDGSAITVGAQAQAGGVVEVFVRDDGPGIGPEPLSRLFERFYRVDKARSREQGGTGLGLSIVKHIVQCHGGKVRAESQPGQGATFFFTLPIERP